MSFSSSAPIPRQNGCRAAGSQWTMPASLITGAHFGEGETTMRVIRAVAEMWQLLRAYSAAMNDIATTAR
jgi:hypothetical protein